MLTVEAMRNILHARTGRGTGLLAVKVRQVGSLAKRGKGWEAVAIVRGIAMAPDMRARRCYAVEIAFESGDYENAVMARVVNDGCEQPPVAMEQGSGVCAWHHLQIKERRRIIE